MSVFVLPILFLLFLLMVVGVIVVVSSALQPMPRRAVRRRRDE